MPASPASRITVVGLGAEGLAGLSQAVRERVLGATVVVGGSRHLAMLPDPAQTPGQQRLPWPHPFSTEAVPAGAVVLASGDPLVSGVGSTLLRERGPDAVEVLPHLSSVQLARARMGWPAETCAVVSVTRRDVAAVLRELAPGRRVLVLSADAGTPAQVAGLLEAAGWGASAMTVLGELGAATESRLEGYARDWAEPGATPFPDLHVLALELHGPTSWDRGWAAGLPDDAFEHDGQLTKRDLRAAALARLAPQPGHLLWDVGAGAGSVGVEWMRAHPACRAVALERQPHRCARIERNSQALGVPGLRVVSGAAPDDLADLPDPDAVFVGGGASLPGVLDTCRQRLRPGGRLVVHSVTLQTERLLLALHEQDGGELTRHAVEHVQPVGTFTSWTPARAVVQWAWTKPHEGGPA
ncbi:precorrin-6y C5,15-methyltransferase (decarboxylating) subunit CbiE [Nocardioides nanhaiensis]|uniref:Bifunctional cobalt-precorrin-7 (C(5))-methyltransferase/cobalt-precorrin-6B (C(15))-methyltransferase n=1 Tax=Nocardioides nanhaiensis TaxID=1476871 RepID=A0ABP8WGX3_9ACTN